MELGVRQFRWHEQFRGIPWNLECANFADRSSSTEFQQYAKEDQIQDSRGKFGVRRHFYIETDPSSLAEAILCGLQTFSRAWNFMKLQALLASIS